jgi:hypothetical protein
MNARVDPFADLSTRLPSFAVKLKREPFAEAAISKIAEDNNFTRRLPPKSVREPKKKRRVYTTGRYRQLNLKATDATAERFYKLADERGVALCKLLEQALDALERAGGS